MRAAKARADVAGIIVSWGPWTTSAGSPALLPAAGAPEIKISPDSDEAKREASVLAPAAPLERQARNTRRTPRACK